MMCKSPASAPVVVVLSLCCVAPQALQAAVLRQQAGQPASEAHWPWALLMAEVVAGARAGGVRTGAAGVEAAGGAGADGAGAAGGARPTGELNQRPATARDISVCLWALVRLQGPSEGCLNKQPSPDSPGLTQPQGIPAYLSMHLLHLAQHELDSMSGGALASLVWACAELQLPLAPPFLHALLKVSHAKREQLQPVSCLRQCCLHRCLRFSERGRLGPAEPADPTRHGLAVS